MDLRQRYSAKHGSSFVNTSSSLHEGFQGSDRPLMDRIPELPLVNHFAAVTDIHNASCWVERWPVLPAIVKQMILIKMTAVETSSLQVVDIYNILNHVTTAE